MRLHLPLTAAVALASAAGLFLALGSGRAGADLEVTIAPGTPLDWARELPDRIPRIRAVATVKKEPKEEPKKGGTGVREKENISTDVVEAKPELGSATYQPKLFSGVLTDDLPFHTPWVKREGDMVMRKYPPTVTDDLYWMAEAMFLRRLLHPTLVPETESFWYLCMLGDSARECCKGAKQERYLAPLVEAIEAGVEAAPAEPPPVPEPDNGDTAEQKMLLKIARDDLMDGDPNQLDPTYAGRILALGELGLPALLKCAQSQHVILRRNAIALLGNYPQPEALAAVRNAFRNDKDMCVKARSLLALATRQDKEIVPDLIKALEDASDKRMRPFAANSLGRIAAKEAVAPLIAAIEGAGEDWDLLVAATPALARAAAANDAAKEALPALKKLEASLRAEKPRFVEPQFTTRQPPDVPDPPEAKNRMLLELATAAMARLQDKEGLQRMTMMSSGAYDDTKLKVPVGHARASGPERQYQCESLKWVCPSSQQAVVEAWGSIQGEGLTRLKQIVEYVKTPETLRVYAIKLDVIEKNKQLLADLAQSSDSASVRGLCVRALFNADEKAGLKLAEGILAAYIAGKPMHKTSPKGDVSVVTALEVLYKAKKLKASVLVQMIDRGMREWEYQRPEVSPEGMKPFKFSPPILETICWMLGATQDKAAVAPLKNIANDKKVAARGEACIALGKINDASAIKALVDLLGDEDGWVRYNAFLGLKGITQQDFFADWVYGTASDREAAVGEWKEYVKKRK